MTKAKMISTPSRRDFLGAVCTTGTAAAATAGLIGLTVQPAKPDTIGDLIVAAEDPLLTVIARYRDGIVAYNTAEGYDEVDSDYDELAERTYAPAFDEIRDHCPPARTLAGAMAAITLAEDEIRDSFSPLCLPLVLAAKAYLATVEG